MSRNPQLEAVFEARYALENAADKDRSARERAYFKLLDESLVKSGRPAWARDELEDALEDFHREFRRAKRQEERAKLSRLR